MSLHLESMHLFFFPAFLFMGGQIPFRRRENWSISVSTASACIRAKCTENCPVQSHNINPIPCQIITYRLVLPRASEMSHKETLWLRVRRSLIYLKSKVEDMYSTSGTLNDLCLNIISLHYSKACPAHYPGTSKFNQMWLHNVLGSCHEMWHHYPMTMPKLIPNLIIKHVIKKHQQPML